MWKVKRMNTARIVVLTFAVGAGGIAAYPADGSDNSPAAKPAQSETLARARQTGALSLALRSIAGPDAAETRSDHHAPRRGDDVHVVRCGVSGPPTALT